MSEKKIKAFLIEIEDGEQNMRLRLLPSKTVREVLGRFGLGDDEADLQDLEQAILDPDAQLGEVLSGDTTLKVVRKSRPAPSSRARELEDPGHPASGALEAKFEAKLALLTRRLESITVQSQSDSFLQQFVHKSHVRCYNDAHDNKTMTEVSLDEWRALLTKRGVPEIAKGRVHEGWARLKAALLQLEAKPAKATSGGKVPTGEPAKQPKALCIMKAAASLGELATVDHPVLRDGVPDYVHTELGMEKASWGTIVMCHELEPSFAKKYKEGLGQEHSYLAQCLQSTPSRPHIFGSMFDVENIRFSLFDASARHVYVSPRFALLPDQPGPPTEGFAELTRLLTAPLAAHGLSRWPLVIGGSRFTVVAQLGAGAVGRVMHVQVDNQCCALKVAEASSQVKVAHLEREVQNIRQLNGALPTSLVLPSLVAEYRDAEHVAFASTPVADGTLRSLRRSGCPEATMRSYGAATVGALLELHTAGFVHGDITADNVGVFHAPHSGLEVKLEPSVVLLDFSTLHRIGTAPNWQGSVLCAPSALLHCLAVGQPVPPSEPVHDLESLVNALILDSAPVLTGPTLPVQAKLALVLREEWDSSTAPLCRIRKDLLSQAHHKKGPELHAWLAERLRG